MTGTPANDPHGLARFVSAQASAYETALRELRSGTKRSHWMWFIFPQMEGLGSSSTARFYAIRGLDEARAYLEHPVLGPRLVDCTQVVLAHAGRPLADIFGYPDDLKFASSMTLFERVAGPGSVFAQALDRMCGGERDARTLQRLGGT